MKPVKKLGLLVLLWTCMAPLQAAMVATPEIALESTNPQASIQSDQRRHTILQLIDLGVDPVEAKLRVGQMTDAQIASLQGEIAALPAGAGMSTTNLLLLIIVLILLL